MSDHSRSNVLVVENKEQLDKILSVRHELPHLRHIVQYTGDTGGEPGVMTWSQLMELGRSQSDEELDRRLGDIAVNQCAGLCYTSGTTGNPKVSTSKILTKTKTIYSLQGVMLSHDSIVFGARETSTLHEWTPTEERIVSYLPLSHIAGMMFDIYYPMSQASTTCFADSNALKGTLIENLKYYKPTRYISQNLRKTLPIQHN